MSIEKKRFSFVFDEEFSQFFISGMRPVSDAEVIAAHHGTKLSVEFLGYLGKTSNMFQFVDIFSIPEITLLRDVTQVAKEFLYFHKKKLNSSFCSCFSVFHRQRNSIRVRIRS